MKIAITRQVSPSIERCELTHLTRTPIDHARACRQHADYESALRVLGVEVLSLPAQPDLPDSVFVEDVALVLDECAVMLRPGAVTRRQEVDSIATALAPYRTLHRIEAPGTVDGGDILTVGRSIFVGLSERSDEGAVTQLQTMLEPHGYDVRAVEVTGCLHLKSAVTRVGTQTLLINPAWVSPDNFPGQAHIEIDPTEPYAANALLVGEAVIYPSAFPRTRDRLLAAGLQPQIVDADELAKAEGALTCCSLIFTVDRGDRLDR